MIGSEVIITVVEIRGDKVRIGIDAPQHIQVNRAEVYHAIQQKNREAAAAAAAAHVSSESESEVSE